MARSTKGLAPPKAARRRERKRKAGIQVRRKKEFTYQDYATKWRSTTSVPI